MRGSLQIPRCSSSTPDRNVRTSQQDRGVRCRIYRTPWAEILAGFDSKQCVFACIMPNIQSFGM